MSSGDDQNLAQLRTSELVGIALSNDHLSPEIGRISMGQARGRLDKREYGRWSKGCGRRIWAAEGRRVVEEGREMRVRSMEHHLR